MIKSTFEINANEHSVLPLALGMINEVNDFLDCLGSVVSLSEAILVVIVEVVFLQVPGNSINKESV